MHYRTLIKNATIVNEGRKFVGSLLIDNDRIAEIVEGKDVMPTLPSDIEIDAEGQYLLPGVIDTHVHFRDPGLTHKGDMHTESLAAVAGGVTTVFDMPNVVPQTTNRPLLFERLEHAAQTMHVNFGLFMGATIDNGHELRHTPPSRMCGIKIFMGSSTGGMLVSQDDVVTRIMEEATVPVVAHCEDDVLVKLNMKRALKRYGDEEIPYSEHPEIRSREACVKATKRAVEMARKTGCQLHVAHVTTADELELFTPGDDKITAEACVAHLLFTDADYAKLGARIKCNPAVKTKEDRDALRKALTDGRITTVATDHAPHLLSEKQGGAGRAASGMPMIQFSLVSMLGLVDEGVLDIERMVELMCHNPAKIFRIENRGFLREGYKADLVLVRPHAPWTLTPNRILSRCNWSPLEGKVFQWRVEKTYVNGALMYSDGAITDDTRCGLAVTREV